MQGHATGSGLEDNARVIRENRFGMAALGDESGTCDWSFSTVTYTVVEKRLTLSEAKKHCEAIGGRLAQPDYLCYTSYYFICESPEEVKIFRLF